MRLKRKHVIILLVLVVSAAVTALTTVASQLIRYPTFQYYGQVLSAEEYMKLIESPRDYSIGCTPLPSVGFYVGDPTVPVDYICFNSEEEVSAYIDEVLAPQWEQISQEHTAPQPVQPPEVESNGLLANHWALYANSFYVHPHLGDVSNSTCYNTSSGVWSAWRDGSPDKLWLFRTSGCNDDYFTYTTEPVPSCVWPQPLGCGGSLAAKVMP